MSLLRRAFAFLSVLVFLPVFGSVAAVGPQQDDAGTGGDAGDIAYVATPVVPGSYSGELLAPVDTFDVYSITGHAGDALTMSFDAESPFSIIARLQLRIDDGALGDYITYGWLSPGGTSTVYLPYDAEWYLQVEPGAAAWRAVGLATYTFSYALVPEAAEVHVLDASAAVVEVDGPFQFHVATLLPDGVTGVLAETLEFAHHNGTAWTAVSAGSTIVRTDSGRWLVADQVPHLQSETDVWFGTSVDSLSRVTTRALVRGELMSTGEHTRMTFAAPIGTSIAVAEVAEVTLVTMDDLVGGGMRAATYQNISGASTGVALDPTFGGRFHGWGEEILLRSPGGSEHLSLPWSPAEGEWSIEAGAVMPQDQDMPLLWGAPYPSLGMYPDVDPSHGYNIGLVFTDEIPL